jgi:hypothetical protein
MKGTATRVTGAGRRCAAAVIGAAAIMACSAGTALADSASVHFRDTSGREDPFLQRRAHDDA